MKKAAEKLVEEFWYAHGTRMGEILIAAEGQLTGLALRQKLIDVVCTALRKGCNPTDALLQRLEILTKIWCECTPALDHSADFKIVPSWWHTNPSPERIGRLVQNLLGGPAFIKRLTIGIGGLSVEFGKNHKTEAYRNTLQAIADKTPSRSEFIKTKLAKLEGPKPSVQGDYLEDWE